MDSPRENLYRGLVEVPELRADDGAVDGTLMHGHFAVFDTWTEIHSWYEGDFLERLAPGAFTKTIDENLRNMVVQFDHGFDVHVGDAPLGPIEALREDDFGVYYEVPLLDTDYNRNRVLPLLEGRTMDGRKLGSQLGASFRFRVVKDEWVDEPKRSASNPNGLPERTIREVRLMEFGPVVFPAYPEATAKVRSLTDHYLDRTRSLRSSADKSAGPATDQPAPTEPTSGHSEEPRTGRLVAQAITTLKEKQTR